MEQVLPQRLIADIVLRGHRPQTSFRLLHLFFHARPLCRRNASGCSMVRLKLDQPWRLACVGIRAGDVPLELMPHPHHRATAQQA
jgi:hypothetical protein